MSPVEGAVQLQPDLRFRSSELQKEEARHQRGGGELRQHLGTSAHSRSTLNKQVVFECCFENQIIYLCGSQLLGSELGVLDVVTLCTVEDLFGSQDVFIGLPLYHFLPFFSHLPSSAELSLILTLWSQKAVC